MVCHLFFYLNSSNVTAGSEEGQNDLVKLNYDCFAARIVDYKYISQKKIEHVRLHCENGFHSLIIF